MAAEYGEYSYVADVSYELHALSHQFRSKNALSDEDKHFITLQQLQLFWDDKKLERVLGLCAHFRGSIVLRPDVIKTRFLRIYSLLVFLEQPHQIELFTKCSLDDAMFPLEDFPSAWADSPSNKHLYDLIHEYQWAYFPVIFEKGRLYNQLLSERMILPIVHEEVMRPGTEVILYRAIIEGSSTFAKPVNGKVKVVRKQYLGTKRKVIFEREQKAFEAFQSRPCRNIVECYGSFGQTHPDGEQSYSLILEHFGASNLDDFFRHASPPQNKGQLLHFWRSFRGLFAALDTIHHSEVACRDMTPKYEIVHQDIKPQNILISVNSLDTSQAPVLKVIDFGYSFTRLSSQTHFLELGGSQAYGCPECSHHGRWKNMRQNSITTAADIWSAGCVMSEAAAWVVGGQAGRSSYEKSRAFEAEQRPSFKEAGHGGCFHDGSGRLRTVDATHQNIRDNLQSYDNITEEVLTLVDDFMLVPMDNRKQAWNIRELLGHIIEKATLGESTQAELLVTSPTTPLQSHNDDVSSPEHLIPIVGGILEEPDKDTREQQPHSPLNLRPENRSELVANILSAENLGPITPSPSSPFVQANGEAGLSMEEAKKYIKDKKSGGRVNPRVQRVIRQLHDNLEGRNYTFFVDTSKTMTEHQLEVTDTLRVYAYIAKQINKNSIDAGFSKNPRPRRYGTTTGLMDALKKQTWNSAAFESSFGTFIDTVIGNLRSWFQLKKGKPQSIFVLTDGRWGRGEVGACGVELPILRLIDAMKAKSLGRTHVMIQFIRFGSDDQGLRRLDLLDQLGVSKGMDIVDTKHFTYDLWAMFFGASNAFVDMEEEEDGPRPVSQPISGHLTGQPEEATDLVGVSTTTATNIHQGSNLGTSHVNDQTPGMALLEVPHPASDAAPSTWKNSSESYPSTIPRSIWSKGELSAKASSLSSISSISKDAEMATAELSTGVGLTQEAEDEKPDDIESLISLDGDIASSVEISPETTSQRQAAVAYLAETFVGDKELCALYELAFRKLDQKKFIRNHRKLLWSFVLNLRTEGPLNPSQNLAVSFLRGWHTRTNISSTIFSKISPSGDTDAEALKKIVSQTEDSKYALGRFLADCNLPTDRELDPLPIPSDRMEEIDSDSDQVSDVDGQDTETAYRHAFEVLEETRDFLCTGQAFQAYKESLQKLLHPERKSKTSSTTEPTPSVPQQQIKTPENRSTSAKIDVHLPREPEFLPQQFKWLALVVIKLSVDVVLNFQFPSWVDPRPKHTPTGTSTFAYRISFCRPVGEFAQDTCKLWLERIAGCQLSWWPLLQPERPLRKGFTRIYSKSRSRSTRFYDDLETSVAEKLFPGLSNRQFSAPSPLEKWAGLSHESVHLANATLSQRLRVESSSPSTIEASQGQTHPTPKNDEETQNAGGAAPRLAVIEEEHPRPPLENTPILFLSGQVDRKSTAALSVQLGEDDKATMKNLRAASQGLSQWRWKVATGIQFYRFKSFHMLDGPRRRIVNLHTDKQRYPEKAHEEFPHYTYSPSPWEEGTHCPCSSAELWYFFDKPEFCGSSKRLIESLPVRRGDPDKSDIVAWGVHIEKHYSAFLILLPVFVACVITLGGTFWFISAWLRDHPGDLQNATVPAFLVMGLVHFVVNTLVTLLLFRWSH